ncbi:MAG TPA: hypothetical protein VFZ72_04100 [Jiangellaceae bacterium]
MNLGEQVQGRAGAHTRRWPASAAVITALAFQLVVPVEVAPEPRWLIPACEAALLLPLVWTSPHHLRRDSPWLRRIALGLVATLAIANAGYLARLVEYVVIGQGGGRILVQAALLIWVTNIVAFAVWFWEIDRGGPFARAPEHFRPARRPDLLFPQMATQPIGWDRRQWLPGFIDYLFVAFTTATTFGPTDTMPLSTPAKSLTIAEAGVSLLTLAIVVARAANIL